MSGSAPLAYSGEHMAGAQRAGGQRRPEAVATPRIAILGAGISGICLGIRLRQAGIESFEIFEKSDGVGGTWRDNSYPGAACDVPAIFYSFSFEVKTDWSRIFPPQAEILAYLEHCVAKYGLEPHLRLRTEVRSARFDEASGHWRLRTADGREHVADVLVSGVGQLNNPNVPDIPGLERFAGICFHSARWDHGHDLAGERVAVIGNGASAVQIVPEIAPRAAHLTIFQRSANWMIPRNDRAITEREKRRLARYPMLARLQRALVWGLLEARWPAFSQQSWLGRRMERRALREMRRVVRDPALQAVLMPDYPIGCKRILISDDYYQTLIRDDVEVVTSPIAEVLTDAIRTSDGRRHPVDAIVLATGFRSTDFLHPIEIRGRDGRSLEEAWRRGAEAYLGIAMPGFPNLFFLYGPNTNLGHNSIIFMIECQVRYLVQCIELLGGRGLSTLEVRGDAMDRWRAECDQSLERSVWATSCESWYKNAGGRITNNWPYGTIAYWRRTRRPRFADYLEKPRPGPVPRPAEAA